MSRLLSRSSQTLTVTLPVAWLGATKNKVNVKASYAVYNRIQRQKAALKKEVAWLFVEGPYVGPGFACMLQMILEIVDSI